MNFQIYNEKNIHNLQINRVAEELFEDGRLTTPQYEQVKTDFPVILNQPNLFVRVGLFLFTTLCIVFTISLVAFLLSNMNFGERGWGILLLICGVMLTAINTRFIQQRHWYRQGSDNALCYAALCCYIFGIATSVRIYDSWTVSLVAFVFLSIATWRYGDPLLAISAFISLLITFFMLINDSQLPHILLPFTGILLSLIVYYLSKTASKNGKWFYWEDCFTVLEITALIVFYCSINYYVVATMLETDLGKGISAPYNIVFAFLTAVIPILYLAIGIQNKDRMLWILGSLGIVASILTYRYYFALMPIEWALTLAGIVLLALSLFLIRYLKTARNGFVYLPKSNKNNLIEALVVNQLLQQAAHSSTPQSNIKYGGGDFDGGGAGSDY